MLLRRVLPAGRDGKGWEGAPESGLAAAEFEPPEPLPDLGRLEPETVLLGGNGSADEAEDGVLIPLTELEVPARLLSGREGRGADGGFKEGLEGLGKDAIVGARPPSQTTMGSSAKVLFQRNDQ